MAYTFEGKIEASDYNNFVDQINEVYADSNAGATGESTGGYGYGQPALAYVSPIVDPLDNTGVDKITKSQWDLLLGTIHECADHQGTSLSIPSTVGIDSQVVALNGVTRPSSFTPDDINAAINSIRNNRFNIDAGIGSVPSAPTESASGNWDSTRTQTITASFSSWDEMRYFFNAQGKIRFSFSFDGTSDNTTETNWIAMSSAIETVSFGYTSTISSGGVGASGGGFYDLTTSDQQIYSYVPSGYSSEQYLIEARLNGSPGSATDIIFTLSFVTPSGGDEIDLTLNSELALFDPSGILTITTPTLTPDPIS